VGSKDFLGSGLKFPLQVDPKTGKIALVHHEEDIAEAIGIIIGTCRGERVMRADFGSTVFEHIFAPANFSARDSIAYDIHEQLLLQEPRIIDVNVTCDEQGDNSGSLIVNVSYTVRNTNNRYNKTYPFYMIESVKE